MVSEESFLCDKLKLAKPSNPSPCTKGVKLKLNKGKLVQLIREEERLGQGMDLNKSPIMVLEEITNQISVNNSKGIVINQSGIPTKEKIEKGKKKSGKARKARMEAL
ncbi:hypothetical protein MKW92_028143, partial [Papaver armeniacum]